MPTIEDIRNDFAFLDDWEDRYRYVIELGRALPPLSDALRTEANKVRGCASQVWVATTIRPGPDGPVVELRGDSDAHIVRGLVALVLSLYSGRTAREVAETDAFELFQHLGLAQHLTPQRSNGVRAMVDRIRTDARRALAEA